MRYWACSLIGIGLFLGSVVVFNLELVSLLNIGTCASGGPYEIARPCPDGTGTDVFLLVASIFGLFISGGCSLPGASRPPGAARAASPGRCSPGASSSPAPAPWRCTTR